MELVEKLVETSGNVGGYKVLQVEEMEPSSVGLR